MLLLGPRRIRSPGTPPARPQGLPVAPTASARLPPPVRQQAGPRSSPAVPPRPRSHQPPTHLMHSAIHDSLGRVLGVARHTDQVASEATATTWARRRNLERSGGPERPTIDTAFQAPHRPRDPIHPAIRISPAGEASTSAERSTLSSAVPATAALGHQDRNDHRGDGLRPASRATFIRNGRPADQRSDAIGSSVRSSQTQTRACRPASRR
jgi:hypothetical protein